MKKEKLEKTILRYSGVATALLGAQLANGQVVWTDITDTTIQKNGGFYDLNIDQDTAGIVDFRIVQVIDSLSSAFSVTGVLVKAQGNAGNQVLGANYGNYNYAFRLNVGDSIKSSRPFNGLNTSRNVGYMAFEGDGNGYPNSQWVDTNNGIVDGFLGLKFRADVNDTIRTFYGWARIDVSDSLESFTIKDFAYESTPLKALAAGQGSPIGIDELETEMPSVNQRALVLDIVLPESFSPEAEIIFTDLSGKMIQKMEMKGHRNSITLENLPKGILVATIRTNGMDSSKKVVIY